MRAMRHQDIIRRAGIAGIASATQASPRAVRGWRERDSIPGWYWPHLANNGLATLEELARGVVKAPDAQMGAR